jgi:hypothetical protein
VLGKAGKPPPIGHTADRLEAGEAIALIPRHDAEPRGTRSPRGDGGSSHPSRVDMDRGARCCPPPESHGPRSPRRRSIPAAADSLLAVFGNTFVLLMSRQHGGDNKAGVIPVLETPAEPRVEHRPGVNQNVSNAKEALLRGIPRNPGFLPMLLNNQPRSTILPFSSKRNWSAPTDSLGHSWRQCELT